MTGHVQHADRNLLFGIIALQIDLITQTQFVEACSTWASRKDMALGDLLVERGFLKPADRDDVDSLVERKLAVHGGDIESSLADALGQTVRRTVAAIPDVDQHFSVAGWTVAQTRAEAASPTSAGRSGDRYQRSHVHSMGGIGRVWVARDQAIGRDVALKELRDESGHNPVLLARFLDEARITGQLEHPGIVPVYELDQGDESARPFYTMRFIRGRTFSDAIRGYHGKRQRGFAGPLDLRELLTAFVTVCNTIAYAHSRGVIHRDIKGANVVLGDFAEVIVLDWGLAKVLAGAPITSSLPGRADNDIPTAEYGRGLAHESFPNSRDLTVQGQVLGTPAYMAPEQAEGRLEAIDRRTDVYGLGALLYEIMTGQAPFPPEDALKILERVIHEVPASPRETVPEMPAALEAICFKALAKQSDLRYQSASALAREIEHFLADEPVQAYPERWPKRLGRWARRHRTLVASAAALLISAVGAMTLGLVLLGRANTLVQEQRDRAEANLTEADHQRQLADANLVRAQKSAAQAKAINDFLVNDLLAEAKPERNARNQKITVEAVVERAAKKIDKAFAGQPEVEAAVRNTIGETLYLLGLYEPAERHLRRSVELGHTVSGLDPEETIATLARLAEVLWAAGKLKESIDVGGQALSAARRVLGPESKVTLTAMNNLSLALQRQGRLAEAEPLCRETLETRKRALGAEHAYTLNAENNLARLLLDQGKAAAAEPLLVNAIDAGQRALGDTEPMKLAFAVNYGCALTDLGRYDLAEKTLRKGIDECCRVQGNEHPYTLIARNNLNRLLVFQGQAKEAEPLCRKNLESCGRVFGSAHQKTLYARDNLVLALVELGRWPEAGTLVAETLETRRRTLPQSSPDLAVSYCDQGRILVHAGKFSEAMPLLRQALQIRREALAAGYWVTANTESALGECMAGLKRYDEAEALLLKAERTLAGYPGTPPRVYLDSVERLVSLYKAWEKPREAENWKAKLPASPPAGDRTSPK